jgi:superfamily II DNA or RNA helicase
MNYLKPYETIPNTRLYLKEVEAKILDEVSFKVTVYGTTTIAGTGDVHNMVPLYYPLPSQSSFVTNTVERLKKYAVALEEENTMTCGEMPDKLLTHQQIAVDYLNINSPYRGLLLYHGLGSGKTCSSIAMVEGFLRENVKIFVLTPKSLEQNFRKELLKCSPAFKVPRHWVKEGKWTYTTDKEPNYDSLEESDREAVDQALNEEIDSKFHFVHTNALTAMNFKTLFPENPFNGVCVIIDEVHQFISRIAAALKNNMPDMVAKTLYEWLLSARNCRVIALTGTPIVNGPAELGVLYNILRGYTRIWRVGVTDAVDVDHLLSSQLEPLKSSINFVGYNNHTVEITRTPDQFENVYEGHKKVGVKRGKPVSDEQFTKELDAAMKDLARSPATVSSVKSLPDTAFDLAPATFKRRILGLTSYFPDLKSLLPELKPLRIHRIPMSEYQSVVYAKLRDSEKKEESDEIPANYRAASRAACNFVFPKGDESYLKDIERYSPKFKEMLKTIEGISTKQLVYSSMLEGLKVFGEYLDATGYEELKVSDGHVLNTVTSKPKYVMYTTSSSESDRELMRAIFNQQWKDVPEAVAEQVKGMKVPLFVVSAAGAEGISLMNVTTVHLMEPYWLPGRMDQVIGRARRICSHPTVEDGVTPHLYLMKDSTDEDIYSMSVEKKKEFENWLAMLKETAIECELHGKCFRPKGPEKSA